MISDLVAALPEIYQPIFGHVELSEGFSRPCADRLDKIIQCYDCLERVLGRPLKVLDLGCAQGYFSLNLASRGATVHGIDYLDKNIEVCNALAKENPKSSLSFETGRIETAIEEMAPGQYDLVVALSVFHHVIHEKGVGLVQQLLLKVVETTAALIIEPALREEPLYWGPSQPENPKTLFGTVAFVHELAKFPTHLSDIRRPLYFASNRYWYLEKRLELFDYVNSESHALADGAFEGSRRYFFSKNSIVKNYKFNCPLGAFNKADHRREIDFLARPPAGFFAAKLIAATSDPDEGWIAMSRLPGTTLLDTIRAGTAIDHKAVLIAVLKQLVVLEKAGLYHNDVRSWNILVSSEGVVQLIDYGSIVETPRDCAWPTNIYLAFLIFVHELVTGSVETPVPFRSSSVSPFSLPQPYRAWAEALWKIPMPNWSFKLMLDTLQANLEHEADLITAAIAPVEAWMLAIEQSIALQKQHTGHITNLQTSAVLLEQTRLQAANTEIKAAQAITSSLQQTIASQNQTAATLLQLQTVEKANANTSAALFALQTEFAQCQQSLTGLQASFDQNLVQLDTANDGLAKLRQQNYQAEQLTEESKLELAQVGQVNRHLLQQLETLEQELVLVQQANRSFLQQLESTEQELALAQQANLSFLLQLETAEQIQRKAEQASQQLLLQLEAAKLQLIEVHRVNQDNVKLADQREQQIFALHASHSWRVTAPFRWLRNLAPDKKKK